MSLPRRSQTFLCQGCGRMAVDEVCYPGALCNACAFRSRGIPNQEPWEDEECVRVSGELICPLCRRPYWKHDSVDRDAPSLVRACDGRLLKL